MTRAESAAALARIVANPMDGLGAFALGVGDPGGLDTQVVDWQFATNGHRSRLGVIGNMQGFAADAFAEPVQVRATPMRTRGATVADRTRATPLVQANMAQVLWVTTRLSGCNVLVMDWGNSLGMVHLQPYHSENRDRLNVDCWGVAAAIKKAMRNELEAVAAASSAQAPTRYILVDSAGHANVHVIGHRTGTQTWTFYIQTVAADFRPTVRVLPWCRWSSWIPWSPFAI